MEILSRLFLISLLWALGAVALAQEGRSASAPLGVAPYVELEREAFLMGLFVPGFAVTAQDVINTAGSRAMEFKFTADRMTAGKLSRLFLQSIAINASPQLQRASADSLAQFFNTLKGSLRTGDVLSISEKTDASGVLIYLNGITLADIDDANFFNLLLLGWIGSVPPSTDFKAALLGNSNADDVARFRHIEPSPERREAVAAWLAPAVESPEPAVEPEVAAAASTSSAALNDEQEEQSSEALASVAALPDADVELVAPALAVAPAALPEAATAANVAQVAAESSAAASSAAPEPAPVAAVPEPEPEEDLPNFSAESLNVLQDYTAQLVQLTHAQIKYPRRAMKLQQTGSVRMAVVIDAEGELVEMQPLLESGYKQLDDAVEKAIEKAAPYPAIPESLPAEHFEFVFPITFMLEQS
ncbi:TonB family protein [Gilvimarinus sp. DA14]|uniref:TonB family protein n=1 Tax=Gilvimarinus sp. DA14 TaxID=2956798 RepID=UPI0020B78106|nr:TonB family protein [Gilvimarinus sp. DA14]UTF58756.1 TonB family protein [Gilvimarinus sp. DA14]